MIIKEVVNALEKFAPLPLQDSYDNAGLQVGLTEAEVSGALLCLDVTEEVIDEAVRLGCNLIISHHPLIFRGLKSITGSTYVERCVLKAVKNGIAIYSSHTNLDNAPMGVSYKMAEKLGLKDVRVLDAQANAVLEGQGAGVVGVFSEPMEKDAFLQLVKERFSAGCVLHNNCGKSIGKVALCGGAGSFLMALAEREQADAFITGEIKYHDFFNSDSLLLVAIGHYESERYTMEIFKTILDECCPGLDTYVTKINTNPINYL